MMSRRTERLLRVVVILLLIIIAVYTSIFIHWYLTS